VVRIDGQGGSKRGKEGKKGKTSGFLPFLPSLPLLLPFAFQFEKLIAVEVPDISR
jgi:hypothetical protein